MSIDLTSAKFSKQKMEYVHNNPCQAHWSLVSDPIDYKFSSAKFYETGEDELGLVTHVDEL